MLWQDRKVNLLIIHMHYGIFRLFTRFLLKIEMLFTILTYQLDLKNPQEVKVRKWILPVNLLKNIRKKWKNTLISIKDIS